MDVVCNFSKAYHWLEEHVLPQSVRNVCFEGSCKKGDVCIDNLLPLPPSLDYILQSSDHGAYTFRQHIRQYNIALVFTSIRYQPDLWTGAQPEISFFRIHSELYHMQGPLEADSG